MPLASALHSRRLVAAPQELGEADLLAVGGCASHATSLFRESVRSRHQTVLSS
jgi:hypothetical protein